MLVKHIMTENVITVTKNTHITEALRIMKEHHFRRLPVVDKGKVVGIISQNKIEHVSPQTTAPAVWQLAWLVHHTKVGDVMRDKVIVVSPDTTVEKAIAIAQHHKVGALMICKNRKIVGIATTNDFFYRVLNPTLGIGEPGTRIEIRNINDLSLLEEIIGCINKVGVKIKVLWALPFAITKEKGVVIHLDTDDATTAIKQLKKAGFKATIRGHIHESTDLGCACEL
ncbi:CBS domain-containing protein [Chloroflexota bacterium]